MLHGQTVSEAGLLHARYGQGTGREQMPPFVFPRDDVSRARGYGLLSWSGRSESVRHDLVLNPGGYCVPMGLSVPVTGLVPGRLWPRPV